jgi:hypothetical protein
VGDPGKHYAAVGGPGEAFESEKPQNSTRFPSGSLK